MKTHNPQHQIDAADPTSVLVILGLLEVPPADTWAEVQPCLTEAGKLGIATSLRLTQGNDLLVRHIAALSADEAVEEALVRVAGYFMGAQLQDVRLTEKVLTNQGEEFRPPQTLEEGPGEDQPRKVLH